MCHRNSWNAGDNQRGLRRYEEEYQAGRKTPNAISLHKELNARREWLLIDTQPGATLSIG
ncbi:hypothetical protein ccbrp13_25410 [Ktedonobacteria bacterium brp13]|nr:hypothetical protein ccbrp13_25410 [Ktedonobacteria bacterium brp13]